ncbi:hypothetical protein E2C01_040544 [Portunus trituberculatus]|uniref:Uncharacterized protein n=1 Tax=Portunus trituberculatus TaxID=210409 RepID=A0A5B7FMY2_PORTR|nr:hypothetical protein [Portunus trituberculatus]
MSEPVSACVGLQAAILVQITSIKDCRVMAALPEIQWQPFDICPGHIHQTPTMVARLTGGSRPPVAPR